MKRITIGVLMLIATLVSHAQEYPQKEVDLEILADELFGFQDLDLNYQELYENMALLLSNPVNLNKASQEDLRFLNLLTEYQVQALISHRMENGPFLSIYELQSVDGFEQTTINRIIPFVTVRENAIVHTFFKRIVSEDNNYLILRYDKTIETKAGFKETANENTRFLGNETDLYIRFRTSNPGDFSIGFTIEKDAGEQTTWNPSKKQYGFDYNSFHAQVMNKGNLKNLIVGDYQSQFGQGLILGGSFGYGKGSETVTTIRRSNLGFLPYTSVNEAGYKRGIALTYQLNPNFFISPFYSFAWRDATLAQDTVEDSSVTSCQTTGLHRNENELRNRYPLGEQNYGAVLSFRKNSLDAGVILSAINFDVPVYRNPQPYNQFSFSGKSNINAGSFLNYTFNNFTFFSEFANTLGDGYALSAGLLGSITQKLDIAFHYRNFSKDFKSLSGNAFSESSTPQNETGLYWGLKYRWNKRFSACGYTDLFSFPWLRYRSYAPSEGYEWLLRFNFQPLKSILFFIQAREESKVRNQSSEQLNQFRTGEGVMRNFWINCDYAVMPTVKLKTRAQFSTFEFEGSTTKGLALLQDISFDIGRISLAARYALFDTEDYDNRQYVYERDVWLAYSLPAYSDTGVRNYVLAQYTFNRHFTVWMRYARVRFTNRDQIGSGSDAIDGNVRTDIRLQVRIKF